MVVAFLCLSSTSAVGASFQTRPYSFRLQGLPVELL